MACFKRRKKERDVAPTRGQFPCPAFGPHGASLSAWVCLDFFLDLFSSFLFFLCPFSRGFLNPNALSLQHCQCGHLRTCAQPRNLPAASARKSLGRFITLITNLIWSRRVNRGHLLSCRSFKRPLSEKAGHTAKNVRRCCSLRFRRVVYLTREETL